MTTIDILKKTRAARGELAVLDEAGKNALLLSMADSLLSHEGAILVENEADMSDARGHISDVMLDWIKDDMREDPKPKNSFCKPAKKFVLPTSFCLKKKLTKLSADAYNRNPSIFHRLRSFLGIE